MKTVAPKISAIAPWFGSNRLLAHRVGELLKGCRWVGVPFAGGMCELQHITANILAVNDLHRHVINLAEVIRDDRERLQQYLDALPFHPDQLTDAQERCKAAEANGYLFPAKEDTNFRWAAAYFVCSWMSRSASAGKKDEFNGGLSVRWIPSGGDSVVRFRNATESLTEWQRIMRLCTFTAIDFFQFMRKVVDSPESGVYCDPPFPGPGDAYKFKFGEEELRRMAVVLDSFTTARVVVRFYDHPLIRELYPEDRWTWHHPVGGKTQTNEKAPEVLLVRNA